MRITREDALDEKMRRRAFHSIPSLNSGGDPSNPYCAQRVLRIQWMRHRSNDVFDLSEKLFFSQVGQPHSLKSHWELPMQRTIIAPIPNMISDMRWLRWPTSQPTCTEPKCRSQQHINDASTERKQNRKNHNRHQPLFTPVYDFTGNIQTALAPEESLPRGQPPKFRRLPAMTTTFLRLFRPVRKTGALRPSDRQPHEHWSKSKPGRPGGRPSSHSGMLFAPDIQSAGCPPGIGISISK